MFSKAIFVVAFAAIAQLATAASPPGCLIGAVNAQSNPSDISAVCKNKDVTSKIASVCGDAKADALSAFADICNKAGVKVDTSVVSSTGSAKPSSTGNSTQSGVAKSTGATVTGSGAAATGTAGTSGTRTGASAQSTGAAGKLEIGAAALIAGLGAMAAAL